MRRKLVFALTLCVTCGFWFWAGQTSTASERRGDPKVPVVVTELPSDVADISWAAELVPLDPAALASPERYETAAIMLSSMLSDPTFRYEIQLWFNHYLSIGHKREEASAMAKGQAAQIAFAFADALVLTAVE